MLKATIILAVITLIVRGYYVITIRGMSNIERAIFELTEILPKRVYVATGLYWAFLGLTTGFLIATIIKW